MEGAYLAPNQINSRPHDAVLLRRTGLLAMPFQPPEQQEGMECHHLEPTVDRIRDSAGDVEIRAAGLGGQSRVKPLRDHFPAVRPAQDTIDQLAENTHEWLST